MLKYAALAFIAFLLLLFFSHYEKRKFALSKDFTWVFVEDNDTVIVNRDNEVVIGPGVILLWKYDHIILGSILKAGHDNVPVDFTIDLSANIVDTDYEEHEFWDYLKANGIKYSSADLITYFDLWSDMNKSKTERINSAWRVPGRR